ncbi:MAG: YfcC family protein [Candidatus Nomurabacteria bacterium]|jgi:uncharacterized ion transporter superfamily protein YfcC|nr:YfcC family protein [Candidatus Nomurabacteria bacterium]
MTEQEAKPKKKGSFWKRLKFPSALTLLFGLIAVVAVLTWIIPSGAYKVGEDDAPIAGTYEQVDKRTTNKDGKEEDVRQGLWDIAYAPVRGFIDAADVIIFVLVIGGFLAVEEKTGALRAGLGKVVRKLRKHTKWIIPILMTLFAIGGTTYGMQEETIAFYPLIIPLVILAGYDAMTAVMIIVYGSIIGVIGSTVNPFSTGIASGFADVSIGDGMLGRVIILVLSLIAGIWFTMRHAAKVKKRNEELEKAEHGEHNHEAHVSVRELKAFKAAREEIKTNKIPRLDGKRKAVIWIFALTFVVMILTVIPWAYKFNITWFEDVTAWLYSVPFVGQIIAHVIPFGDWWFGEIATLFLISSIVIACVFKMKEGEFTKTFVEGAMALLGVALIIAASRGISIVMKDGMIADTIINWGENGLSGLQESVFGVITYIFYLPLSILIPSTSGLATATMPILAPLADFAGVGRDLVVTAFQSSVGLVNMIAPTVGSLVGGLALAKVSYGAYLKRSWPLFIILALISTAVIAVLAVI